MTKKRTEVADIDRSMYDFRYDDADAEKLDEGLTFDIVREISAKKDEIIVFERGKPCPKKPTCSKGKSPPHRR